MPRPKGPTMGEGHWCSFPIEMDKNIRTMAGPGDKEGDVYAISIIRDCVELGMPEFIKKNPELAKRIKDNKTE